jgi:hypothetical protein
MAKDKPNGGKPKDKSLHFFVPQDFHRRLKMVCAYEGKTLKDYVMGALQGALVKSEHSIATAGSAEASSTSSDPATSA